MQPELLSAPHISSYPVLLLIGFFLGYLLARRRGPAYGIEGRHIDNLVLILLVMGPLGSRLFSRWFYLPEIGFWRSFRFWEGGGLVFYGGFIFGIASVLAYSLIRRIPSVAVMDAFAPSLALGLAFGRIGCFMGGCCWGDVCLTPQQEAGLHRSPHYRQVHTIPAISPSGLPWAVSFPKHSDIFLQHAKLGLLPPLAQRSLPVHPVQLYECALALALSGSLARYSRKPRKPGNTAIAMVMGYALIRFLVEFLRADNNPVYWGMTFSQVVSVLMAAGAFIALCFRGKNESATPEPSLGKLAGEPT